MNAIHLPHCHRNKYSSSYRARTRVTRDRWYHQYRQRNFYSQKLNSSLMDYYRLGCWTTEEEWTTRPAKRKAESDFDWRLLQHIETSLDLRLFGTFRKQLNLQLGWMTEWRRIKCLGYFHMPIWLQKVHKLIRISSNRNRWSEIAYLN